MERQHTCWIENIRILSSRSGEDDAETIARMNGTATTQTVGFPKCTYGNIVRSSDIPEGISTFDRVYDGI